MNVNHHNHPEQQPPSAVVVVVPPVALQRAFRRIDPTGEGQQLILHNLTLTRVEAQFVHDYLLQRRNDPRPVISVVHLVYCRFSNTTIATDSDDNEGVAVMNIFKDCFIASMTARNAWQIKVQVMGKKDVYATWFPILVDFCTVLKIGNGALALANADFQHVVDTILNGNGRQNLQALNVRYNNITSHGLAKDAARLVQQSHVRRLSLSINHGLLNNLVHTRVFCDALQHNKHLLELYLNNCSPSQDAAQATTTLLVDLMRTKNTTLTRVHLEPRHSSEQDEVNQGRLDTWTRRNRRLATVLVGVQELLNTRTNNNNNNNNGPVAIPEALWGPILQAALHDIDRDKTALFLLLCQATVGPLARPLHETMVHALRLRPLCTSTSEQHPQQQR